MKKIIIAAVLCALAFILYYYVALDSSGSVVDETTISLPLPGSTPTQNVAHIIPIEEIKRGCFQQDCIPSVDNPGYTTPAEASQILGDEALGIGLSYKGVERFYPFDILVTKEIVNDTVAGDALLVTYCPLCGTGIVFDREVDGEVLEFGVSGMLWQSNLLMYNRALDLNDRNLWSQVLGEAVVGHSAGTKLNIIPSDIIQFGAWKNTYPQGEVLVSDSGRQLPVGDPYGGEYFRVAANFDPNFDLENSPLDPSVYVYGIEVEDVQKAYVANDIPLGTTTDEVAGKRITITRDNFTVSFRDENAVIPDVEGFWFSWVAARPDTLLWNEAE